MRISARTDTGKVRRRNEDRFIVCSSVAMKDWSFDPQTAVELRPMGALLAVADGMGGMSEGDTASRLAVEAIRAYFNGIATLENQPENMINALKASIQYAHRSILSHQTRHPETEGMGTTIVVSWILNETAYIAWRGDSRGYLYHPRLAEDKRRVSQLLDVKSLIAGNLLRLTKDHSYVQELVDAGEIPIEQAFRHPYRNVISKSLGDIGDGLPDIFSFDLQDGDRIMLCSDGLCGALADDQIGEIIGAHPDLEECVDALISAANEASGDDNVTVAMAEARLA